MKIIKYGQINDCGVYGIICDNRLYPLSDKDMYYLDPDVLIEYDSGAYPGITDLEQYLCDQVMINNMLDSAEDI